MIAKKYTNEKYIPINELSPMGDSFLNQVKQYREQFTEIIQLDKGLAYIVETPELIKERFIHNMKLKGKIKKEYDDIILEIAKDIVKKEIKSYSFNKDNINKLIKVYESNNFDLTLITKYIIENIEKVIKVNSEEVGYMIPQLTKSDIKFIKKYNKQNQHYSISEYINENNNSYETGRKAMEKMVGLQLYKKEKLGKKFVYTPTNKLIAITEGGEYGN